jgi:hypothetical protein
VIRKKPGLDDKEQAFIAAARQELAARKPAAPVPPRPAPAAPTTSLRGSTVLGWDHPAAQPTRRAPAAPTARTVETTPIDTPTVDGWDHPSALNTAPKVKIAAEEKWARVAAAMEAEQREARQAREKMRRIARRFAIGATVVIVLAVVSFLHR